MSTTEYVIIAVSIGIIILGVPLVAVLWQRNREQVELDAVIDEQTPLRTKHKETEDNDPEDGASFDSASIINRVLANGIVLHTTKGPKKVCRKITWFSPFTFFFSR